jgi:hypothetical protein
MKVRVRRGVTGDTPYTELIEVMPGTSVVFLEPSVITQVLHARFYSVDDRLHQIPATEILEVAPDDVFKQLPVRYRDPISGDVIAQNVAANAEDAKVGKDIPPVDRTKTCTTSGEPVDKVRAEQTEPTGQHKAYIMLCEEERKKGFVRPYRDSYKHVGIRPTYPTRELTAEEHERYDPFGYVSFEEYPEGSPEKIDNPSVTGRFWTARDLKSGCGAVTTMGRALSETYQRDPTFYGSTYCYSCNRHFPVAEFIWTADGQRVGS